MCTAIADRHLFGRTLDLEYTYSETVTVTPRNFPFAFRGNTALIGMATVAHDYPLYYEAANEHGLAAAGLNFPQNAHYVPAEANTVASFDFIPYILTQCRTLAEARARLAALRINDTPFSADYPPSPLHWLIADASGAITVESTAHGLQVYDNPVGVLTNNPPFPCQLNRLADYAHLKTTSPAGSYSRGLGAVGLPGDWSSPSRFVRAAFAKTHTVTENDPVCEFFHTLGTVSVPRGTVQAEDGRYVVTAYTSCIDLERGVYYYTTYQNHAICAVHLHRCNLNGTRLTTYPLHRHEQIIQQN